MIEEAGGKVLRAEEGHPPGRSTHNEPHVNYMTPAKPSKKATVIVKPWK